jgi:hypothetical protein
MNFMQANLSDKVRAKNALTSVQDKCSYLVNIVCNDATWL